MIRPPLVIRLHAFDPSELKTCIVCHQPKDYRLHIAPHAFEPTTPQLCRCGMSILHLIHRKGIHD
jgi:hypothetical protein